MNTFAVPTRVSMGSNSLNTLTNSQEKSFFIITDPFLKENKMVEKVIAALPAGANYQVCDKVRPDPKIEWIQEIKEELDYFSGDHIIAFGGGSAIDTSKALIYLALKGGQGRPAFSAIPSTAGTGSEVTNFSIVTVGQKKEVWIDDHLYPDHAILNAAFTKSVPARITADTGVDVLTHALEAYVSKNATIYSDSLAIQAMRVVFAHLPIVYEDGLRMKSRDAMIRASCMAGIAFTNAGLGINHSLAHALGGRYHIAHGRLNGVLFPYVLKYNQKHSEEAAKKLERLPKELGLRPGLSFLDAYLNLARGLDFEPSLSYFDKINANDFYQSMDEIADTAYQDRCTPTNPAIVTRIALQNILRDVYEGK